MNTNTVTAWDLKRKGGDWLGEAHSWILWNVPFGDTLTWGSDEMLRVKLTVRELEDFAAHVAAAAINEERRQQESTKVTK